MIRAAHVDRIRDDHELENILHEATFYALTKHKIHPEAALITSIIRNIITLMSEECDTGTLRGNDAYYLVPIPTSPQQKATA
jgi:hypothetical protein